MAFIKEELIQFIGRGLTLPLDLINGKPPLRSGFELIRASIINIITWPESTRFFLAEFGSKLENLIEEPNDATLRSLVETYITEAIETWEKRIELISADSESVNDTQINITIHYRVIATQRTDTFIFPFYTKIIY